MIRALISDLGNVLLHFDHRLITRRLEKHFPEARREADGEQQLWPLIRAFESGSIDADAFLAHAKETLGLSHALTEAEFRILWADIFWPNQELIDLLAGLRDRLTLVMLSNTNPVHIEFARARFPELFSLFRGTVFSFETGSRKPDPAIFREALRVAGASPEETLYFDDVAEYADAASALGMHGYQYVSIDSARDVLRIYDVLPR